MLMFWNKQKIKQKCKQNRHNEKKKDRQLSETQYTQKVVKKIKTYGLENIYQIK